MKKFYLSFNQAFNRAKKISQYLKVLYSMNMSVGMIVTIVLRAYRAS